MLIRKRNVLNNQGLTLIELLVSLGAASIVSLAVATLLTDLKKSENGIIAKNEQREEIIAMQRLLSDVDACKASLAGLNPVTGASIPAGQGLKNAAGAVVFALGGTDGSNKISYQRFTVQNYVQDAAVPLPTQIGRGNLVVRMQKEGQVAGGREVEQSFSLYMKLNANQITDCYMYAVNTNSLWRITPSNQNNIFYSSLLPATGKVGIGIDNPIATLDVAGSVRATAGPTNGYRFPTNPFGGSGDFGSMTYELLSGAENMGLKLQVGNDPQDEIQLRASGPIKFFTNATQRMIINSTGDVGIGAANPARKLHVARTDGVGGVVLQLEVTPVNTVYQQYTTPGFDFFTGMRANGDFALEDVFNGTSPRIFIQRSTGRVGIGTTTPESELHVNGAVQASQYNWTSDANLKNIVAPSAGLAAIKKLTGYKFAWKQDDKVTDGVIAQQVEKVFPELVKNGSEYKSVNYMGLVAPLIESVKQLQARQKFLQNRIEQLEKEIAAEEDELN